ncbi:MAG: hypothetical protein AAF840_01715 [Bacteroidota bacterium]
MKYFFLLLVALISAHSLACSCNYGKLDSAHLEQYAFIAHIKVDSILADVSPDDAEFPNHRIRFHTLKLFKGEPQNFLRVSGANKLVHKSQWTSCDMGITPGEEWVIFALPTENQAILQTGYCTFSKRYRSARGLRDWHYQRGFKELAFLAEFYQLPDKKTIYPDGLYTEKYPNGQTEVEAHYNNGVLHGSRKRYSPDGQTLTVDFFLFGKQEGISVWQDTKGRLMRLYKYADDHPIDSCFLFNPKGVINNRRFYDAEGRLQYHYSAKGGMGGKRISIYDYKKNRFRVESYDSGGGLSYMTLSSIEPYQRLVYKEWGDDGKLEFHYKYRKDGSQKTLKEPPSKN